MSEPTGTSKEQRLRTACDGCQASKVKCSRAKPSCWRCNQSGQPCVYSPLRKTGRPPKTSAAAPEHRVPHATQKRQQQPHGAGSQLTPGHGDRRAVAALPLLPGITLPEPTPNTGSGPRLGSNGQRPTGSGPESTVIETGHPDQPQACSANDPQAAPAQDLMRGLDFDTCGFGGVHGIAQSGSASIEPMSSLFGSFPNHDQDLWDWNVASWNAVFSDGDCALALPTSTAFPRDSETLASQDGFSASTRASMSNEPDSSPRAGIDAAGAKSHCQAFKSRDMFPQPALFSRPQLPSVGPTSVESRSPSPEEDVRQLGTTDMVPTSSNGPGCSGKCYKDLWEIVARVNEHESGSGEGPVSVDTLLGLDRELHQAVRQAQACRLCKDRSGSQTTIILVMMAMNNLLGLFEKQQDVVPVAANAVAAQTRMCHEPFRPATISSARHNSAPGTSRQRGKAVDEGCRNETLRMSQTSVDCISKSLLVGSFAVGEEVKAAFVRQLVLECVKNLEALLAKLETQFDPVLKGINRRMAKEMAGDICKRAFFLRGKLRLATINR